MKKANQRKCLFIAHNTILDNAAMPTDCTKCPKNVIHVKSNVVLEITEQASFDRDGDTYTHTKFPVTDIKWSIPQPEIYFGKAEGRK